MRITATAVEISQTIEFELNRDVIRTESHDILNQVAAALRAHPEIRRVRVEGNTDLRGRASRNLSLSTRRAAAVVAYFRAHEVTTTLESIGYGMTHPLCQETTEECHQRNRRVAFTILERAPAPPEGGAATPPAGGAATPAPPAGGASTTPAPSSEGGATATPAPTPAP